MSGSAPANAAQGARQALLPTTTLRGLRASACTAPNPVGRDSVEPLQGLRFSASSLAGAGL